MKANPGKIKGILEQYPSAQRDTLIPILQEVQDKLGFITESSVIEIAQHLKLPTSKIFGLATFYNQFKFDSQGKYHIKLCNGSSCHLKGTEKIIKELEKELKLKDGETSRDKLFSLEIVPCIGACGQSPVMSVNDQFYCKVTPADIKEIISQIREENKEGNE